MHFAEIVEQSSKNFLPSVRRLPVALARGAGSRVWDVDGKVYIDLSAGWGVTCIGHCHPALVAAISRQAGQLMQTTNLFYTEQQAELVSRLAAKTAPALTRLFLTSSGTEAMEGALKLAHRATGRTKFVCTQDGFHGRTLGALAVNGQEKHRAPYARLLPPAHVVPFGDIRAAADAIDESTAAFVVEPIQGEGGVHVAPIGYLAALRERCTATGALLILDEIQTGVGRTGRFLAQEHDGIAADVVTLGKGLGGGFPIAAFATTEAVAASVKLGDHGGTYSGNPLACAAANAVLETLEREQLVSRCESLGSALLQRLRDFAAEHRSVVRDVRGRGLLVGIEVTDEARAQRVLSRCLERGVIINVTAGTVVRLFPALNVPDQELQTAVDTVLEAIALS